MGIMSLVTNLTYYDNIGLGGINLDYSKEWKLYYQLIIYVIEFRL
jgi:hypothetical protein